MYSFTEKNRHIEDSYVKNAISNIGEYKLSNYLNILLGYFLQIARNFYNKLDRNYAFRLNYHENENIFINSIEIYK